MSFAYEDAIRREVGAWPGAAVDFSMRSRHAQAVLTYGNGSRFVVLPGTPGDSRRGALNSLADVRRELTRLGAARQSSSRSTRSRKPTPRVHREALRHIEPAPRRGNPFDVLASYRAPEPVQQPVQWVAPLAVLLCSALKDVAVRIITRGRGA